MKSNKELTAKEFEVSQLLKRAMQANGMGDSNTVRTYLRSALSVLYKE